ncbi:MAG: L,D-transpeptidase family protein [Segniliparus sp.]|uniref:L,D-transpeptidase family protein n=1 Tax=Segniliparus sp. TaxID=2804064 RepID=UPI003F330394
MIESRSRRSLVPAVASLVAVCCGPLAPHAAASPSVAPSPWFTGWVGGAAQVVAVTGDDSGQAVVEAWEKTGGAWTDTTSDMPGWIGAAGLTQKVQDDVPATPVGVFSLSEAFGTDAAPQTAIPYRQTGPNDWWVGDVKSPLYNSFATCAPGSCSFDEKASEQLDDDSYSLAVVIGVNPRRIPGAGNAYFLHVAAGAPTEGCVSMEKADLRGILTWLRPGAVIAVRQGTATPPGPASDVEA